MANVDVLSLIGAQKAEFNHASRLRSWVLRAQMIAGGLAAASVFVDDSRWLYAMALAGVILAAGWLYLSVQLSASRGHAERLRRATLLAGGLGLPLPGADLINLARGGRAPRSEADRLVDPDYFASKAPPGPQRFLAMLEESAIWTTNLAVVAAREAWMVFGGSLIAMVLALLVGFIAPETSHLEQVARVFFAMMTVLLSADFLGAAKSYSDAHISVDKIIQRLQAFKHGAISIEPLMLIFADYNSAVEAMPLFPRGLYGRHEKRLNEDYQMYLTGPQ